LTDKSCSRLQQAPGSRPSLGRGDRQIAPQRAHCLDRSTKNTFLQELLPPGGPRRLARHGLVNRQFAPLRAPPRRRLLLAGGGGSEEGFCDARALKDLSSSASRGSATRAERFLKADFKRIALGGGARRRSEEEEEEEEAPPRRGRRSEEEGFRDARALKDFKRSAPGVLRRARAQTVQKNRVGGSFECAVGTSWSTATLLRLLAHLVIDLP
jgi:hypothetical protein